MAFVGHNAVIEEQWGNPALLVPPLPLYPLYPPLYRLCRLYPVSSPRFIPISSPSKCGRTPI